MNDRVTNTRPDGDEPAVPSKLLAALKEPTPRRVFVPPTIDEAVLRAAREHLAQPPRIGLRLIRSWLAWPALATACLALAGLIYLLVSPPRSAPQFAIEDLNHDGKVDILDAFQLARELQAGKANRVDDLNHDGVVDRRDVDLIATHAVKLEKGGRS